MKAHLEISGRKYNVLSIAVEDINTKEIKHVYVNTNFPVVAENQQTDLAKSIESSFEKRIVEDLNQLLVDSKDHLKVLGEQIIKEVLEHNGLPFGDSLLPNLVKEYKEHSDYISGVESALEVVKRDNYA